MGSIQDHDWEACFCSTAGPVGILFIISIINIGKEGKENRGTNQSPCSFIVLHTNRVIKLQNTLFGMKSPRFSILLESVGWVEFPRLEKASSNQSSLISGHTLAWLGLVCKLTIK